MTMKSMGITIMTMSMKSMGITAMTTGMKSMDITTMNMGRAAHAAAMTTIITIMQMKYLQAGAKRRRIDSKGIRLNMQ
jgi:hypothetical protein